jgi:hypothetical protein
MLKYSRTVKAVSSTTWFDYPPPVCGLGQGHIVQGTHRPRDASSKRRIVQGTHGPREASSKRRIVQGHIVQGHIVQETHRLSDI